MSLRDLYQSMIVDHGRNPRNFGELSPCTHTQKGWNPLCGDQMTLYLQVNNNQIEKAQFVGSGCAISMASASLLTEIVVGKTVQEANALFTQFHAVVTGSEPADLDALGKLAVLVGVAEFPARVKCATLAWHSLQSALNKTDNVVTTE